LKQLLTRLWKEEEAQDLVEYVLLLALFSLATITSLRSLASAINGALNNTAASLNTST
jgi:Flp pilus assembly pilin Flp